MCDYGVISGPLITSAIYGGAATAAESAAVGTALSAASTAAVLAAGTGVSMYGANQNQQQNQAVANATNQQNAALADQERQRQQKLQGQKEGVFYDTLGETSRAAREGQQNTDASYLTKDYSAPADEAQNSLIPGLTGNTQTDAGPKLVKDTYKNDLKGVGDYLRGQAGSKAQLDAFQLGNIRTGDIFSQGANSLSLLNNFAQGSKSILPIEQAANNQGAQYQFQSNDNQAANTEGLGNLISGLGVAGSSLAANRSVSTPAATAATRAKKAKPSSISQLGTSSFLPS